MPYGIMQCMLFAGALRADNFHCSVAIDEGTFRGGTCGGLLA